MHMMPMHPEPQLGQRLCELQTLNKEVRIAPAKSDAGSMDVNTWPPVPSASSMARARVQTVAPPAMIGETIE